VIDSAFHVIARAGRPRHAPAVVPGPRTTVDVAALRPDATLVEGTLARVRDYLAQHREAVACIFRACANPPGPAGCGASTRPEQTGKALSMKRVTMWPALYLL